MISHLERLDAEIMQVEQMLAGLRRAREILTGAAETAPAPRQMLRLEGPKPAKSRKALEPKASETEAFMVNHVRIPCTPAQLALFEALDEAEPEICVPVEKLMPVFGGKKFAFFAALKDLREKLVHAKATIGSVRGDGYRLENL